VLYHRDPARRQRGAPLDFRGYTCALCARGHRVTKLGSAWYRCAAYGCAVLLAVLVAGCGGSSSNGNFVPVNGFLRAVNAIPDSPTLSVGINAGGLGRISFAQATNLTPFNATGYAFDALYVSGTTAVSVVSNLAVSLQAEQQVSIFLMGSMAAPTTKMVVNPIPEIAAGEAEFQVVHAASGQSTLDVYVTDAAAPLADATPITIAYEGQSDLLTIPAGANYRLRVTQPGDVGTVLYDSGAFPIASLARVTFVLVDYFGPGGNGFRAVQLTNISAATFPNEVLPGALRVADMIANQTAVDVYVGATGGVPTFADVAFGEIGARQQFDAGSLAITVTPASTPDTVLFSGNVTLNPGESRTLAFAFNGSEVVGRFALDSTRSISVQPQVQTVQASPASGDVDVYLLSSGETVDDVNADLLNLPLLSVTASAPVAGSYDVDVTAAGDKTVVAGPLPITVDDGGIYTMYLSDAPGGGLPPQIILGDDFN
jgi:Domain of unknown function (DUF4397)